MGPRGLPTPPFSRPLLAFVHMEKAAGTTLIHLLRRYFLLSYMDVRPLSAGSRGVFSARDMARVRRIWPFVRCIGGHGVTPASDLATACDVRYFALFRDPASRFVSRYLDLVRRGRIRPDFEAFLQMDHEADFQARKVAGRPDPDAACRAVDSLAVAGVAERFHEFLAHLPGALDLKGFDARHRKVNVGPDPRAARELLDRYGPAIRERNQADQALYDHVTRVILPRQRARWGKAVAPVSTKGTLVPDGVDYLFRKLYVEPVTGRLRRRAGLPSRGSY